MDTGQRDNDIFNLNVDETGKAHMLEAARWAKFISWVLIIIQGLMVIFTVVASFANGMDVSEVLGAQFGAGLGLVMFAVYAFIILLFFYPLICLLKFSRKIKPAIKTGNTELFNEAFHNLKNMFKFFGITIIILLVVYGLVMIFGILSLAVAG